MAKARFDFRAKQDQTIASFARDARGRSYATVIDDCRNKATKQSAWAKKQTEKPKYSFRTEPVI